MANGYFSVRIATKPYLKKYLQSLYGSTILLTTDNSFGVIVEALLTRPLEDHNSAEVLRQRFDKYTDTLEFFVPKRNIFKRKGFALTERHVISLNKFFEKQFCEHLLTWCEMGVIYQVEYKKNIEDFCWRHKIEIDEDISLDAIQKKEYRARKKKQEKKENCAPLNVRSKVAVF